MRAGKLEVSYTQVNGKPKVGFVFRDAVPEERGLTSRQTPMEGDEMVVVNRLLAAGWKLIAVLVEETRSVETGRVEAMKVTRKVYYMTSVDS